MLEVEITVNEDPKIILNERLPEVPRIGDSILIVKGQDPYEVSYVIWDITENRYKIKVGVGF